MIWQVRNEASKEEFCSTWFRERRSWSSRKIGEANSFDLLRMAVPGQTNDQQAWFVCYQYNCETMWNIECQTFCKSEMFFKMVCSWSKPSQPSLFWNRSRWCLQQRHGTCHDAVEPPRSSSKTITTRRPGQGLSSRKWRVRWRFPEPPHMIG